MMCNTAISCFYSPGFTGSSAFENELKPYVYNSDEIMPNVYIWIAVGDPNIRKGWGGGRGGPESV